MRKILAYPVLIFFISFILLFSVADIINSDKGFSEFENRYLTQKPEFSFKDLLKGEFSSSFEKYINDQFIGRDYWISLKSFSESILRKIENNGIIYGKDKYMFDKYTVLGSRFDLNLKYLSEFLDMYEDKNISFALIPNSYEILKEKLPRGTNNIDQTSFIRLAYESMISDNVKKIDLISKLREHSNEYIYYRTDHHWTTLGAYYAYVEYSENLGLDPVDITKLNEFMVPGFFGTYYKKSKLFNAVHDKLSYYDIPVSAVEIEGRDIRSMYDFDALEKKDKYAFFLHNNNGYMVIKSMSIENKNEEDIRRLLVIKDSYANSFIPFLTFNYDEIHVIDLRYMQTSMKSFLSSHDFSDILIMYNFMNFASDTNIPKLRY